MPKLKKWRHDDANPDDVRAGLHRRGYNMLVDQKVGGLDRRERMQYWSDGQRYIVVLVKHEAVRGEYAYVCQQLSQVELEKLLA